MTKLVQIVEQNCDMLFQPVYLEKSRDVSVDSNESNSSSSPGNWVKRVLKIQKVLKMMEHNMADQVNLSKITDPLCQMLKENMSAAVADISK